MQETQVRSLIWEDPLEKEVATHSSILAGKSHGQPSMQQSVGSQRIGHDLVTQQQQQQQIFTIALVRCPTHVPLNLKRCFHRTSFSPGNQISNIV